MSILPNPFLSSDGGVDGHAQSHALGLLPKYNQCGNWKPEVAPSEGFGASKDEPAGIESGPSDAFHHDDGGAQEALAAIAPNPHPAAGALDELQELLAYAHKRHRVFVPDEEAILAAMWADPAPLFLRQVG